MGLSSTSKISRVIIEILVPPFCPNYLVKITMQHVIIQYSTFMTLKMATTITLNKMKEIKTRKIHNLTFFKFVIIDLQLDIVSIYI